MWRGVIGVFFTAAVFAQQVTPVDKLPGGAEAFDATQHHESLPCTVTLAKPQLNLGFRFETTYAARIPLDGYGGAEHKWQIIFRVTPRGAPPVYFTDSFELPGDSDRTFEAIARGTFFTGEGDYDVQFSLWDDLGRVCRRDGRVEAHLTGHERDVKVEMPPEAIGDFAWQPEEQKSATTKARRITVLMNAAVPRVNRGQSADNEWPTLLTILSSLVEQLPEASVRLVVFNLDQQRELFRKDDFTAKDIAGIAQEGDAAGRWAVDANVLQNPAGGWELIGKLENAEIHATPTPDTVLFLGLPAAGVEKMPDEMPRSEAGGATRFFNLSYHPPEFANIAAPRGQTGDPDRHFVGARGRSMGVMPARSRFEEAPDPIAEAVRRTGGRTMEISSPDTLSEAIAAVRKSTAKKN